MIVFCNVYSEKTLSLIKALFLLLILCMYSGLSYSAPKPPGKTAWFYRVDTRPPEVIFSEGFTPRGNNLNLVDHFLSMMCELGNAGFVSVTDNFKTAVFFAATIIEGRNKDFVYLYQVSPEAGFYNVEYSIRMHMEDIFADGSERVSPLNNYTRRLYSGLSDFSWEREWVAANEIPAHSVRAVYKVRLTSNSNPAHSGLNISVDENSVPNPGFIASDTLGYLNAYPIPLPAQDVPSPVSSTTCSDDSDEGGRIFSDSIAVPSTSGYVSNSMIYPACQRDSDSSKRSAQPDFTSEGCPGSINLTDIRRNRIIISTILDYQY